MDFLIAIITAHHASRIPFAIAARNSWLKGCQVDYKFVYGNNAARNPLGDELFFDCSDARGGMALKDQEVFKYALSRGYDYVFRCCDDTFVFPEKLVVPEQDYVGKLIGVVPDESGGPWGSGYMHGGCGMWLSRKAMTSLVADPIGHYILQCWHDRDLEFTNTNLLDDIWMGEVLQGNLPWNDPRRYKGGTYEANDVQMRDDARFVDQSGYDSATIAIHTHRVDSPLWSGAF